MTHISLPPKLSVPQLDQVIDRERLFAQLDQRLTGAVVWLEGMAGAGKTVLAALLRAQAPALAAQGYYGLLEQGLRRLPASWLAADPWLPYWLGMVRLPFDMTEARAWLVQAYRAFRDAGESASAVAAWVAIVDSYALEFADFSPLDDWIAEADRLAAGELAGLPEASRHRFALGMFTALVCRQPDRPDIRDWADQVEDQIRACPDPEQRLGLGCQLGVYYLAWRGRRDQAEPLLARLAPFSYRL